MTGHPATFGRLSIAIDLPARNRLDCIGSANSLREYLRPVALGDPELDAYLSEYGFRR